MRTSLVVAVLAGALVLGLSGPAWGAPHTEAEPRSYVEDEDLFFNYLTRSSASDCGGNPACDISFTTFSVSKDSPDELLVVTAMAGPTSPNIPNSTSGGMLVYIDSDPSRAGNEFGMWTWRMSYPLREAVSSPVYAWDGAEWQETASVGYWLRSDRAWGALIPWQDLGIKSARLVVRSDAAEGQFDYSPASGFTSFIPIAALVAGAPGQPTDVVATPGMGQVSLSWKAPVSTGASAVTSYRVTASPGGATCTSTSTSCTVTGLTAGTAYSFEVTATNAQGTGPASDVVSATPEGKVAPPGKVRDLEAFSLPGKSRVTVTWKAPLDTGGVALTGYQVRVGKKPWASTSIVVFTVSPLKAGQVVTVQVRAVNQSGPGPVSKVKVTVR